LSGGFQREERNTLENRILAAARFKNGQKVSFWLKSLIFSLFRWNRRSKQLQHPSKKPYFWSKTAYFGSGKMVLPDGKTDLPDGKMVPPGDKMNLPDGEMVSPGRKMVLPDGYSSGYFFKPQSWPRIFSAKSGLFVK
jgi:hypothetical protein